MIHEFRRSVKNAVPDFDLAVFVSLGGECP